LKNGGTPQIFVVLFLTRSRSNNNEAPVLLPALFFIRRRTDTISTQPDIILQTVNGI